MALAHYNTEAIMTEMAKAATTRFRDDLRAKIMAQVSSMIDDIIADIAKDMEVRAMKSIDAGFETVIVQYINNSKKET